LTRLPSLDGLRAVSILLVLLSHCAICTGFPDAWRPVARHGEVGVTVFFVISGFLITLLLVNEQQIRGAIDLKAFYLRRAFRILPVFLLYTLFIVLWKNVEPITISRSNLLHALTFTVNFDWQRDWFIGHYCTLSVEEQFYLLFPPLVLLFRKTLKPVLILLIAYSCLARVIGYKYPDTGAYFLSPFFSYADAILAGVLGALLYHRRPEIIRKKIFTNGWLQFAAFSLISFFLYASGGGKWAWLSLPFGPMAIAFAILFLILCYLNPLNKVAYRLLNSRVLVHIGLLSYSIYVWQQFFFVGRLQVIWRVLPFNLAAIYLVALASYFLWEKPFLRLRKHFITVH